MVAAAEHEIGSVEASDAEAAERKRARMKVRLDERKKADAAPETSGMTVNEPESPKTVSARVSEWETMSESDVDPAGAEGTRPAEAAEGGQ